ncbi:MAG: hypothetical protein GY861_00250 [bacterium]|nr:hypothetical protein [bacterium]
MSYCRFQNTLSDLQDCVDYLEAPSFDSVIADSDDDYDENMLSADETQARADLVALCNEI